MFACHRPRPYDLQVKPNTTTHCGRAFFETLNNVRSRRSPGAMSGPRSDLAERPRTLPIPVLRAGVAAGYRAVVQEEADPVGAMLAPGSDVSVIRLGWAQDHAAPSNFIEPLFTCKADENDGVNVSQFCNRRVEALVARARATSDAAAAGAA
jgi:hypothetical protein